MSGQTIGFFTIFVAALFFSEVSSRFRVPWVVALIVAGIIIGPFGLQFVEIDQTIGFLGDLGLVFLMFMAGLETKFSTFNEYKKEIVYFALGSGGIPFAAGLVLSMIFGFSSRESFMIATIFISSSIAVVVPTLESQGLMKLKAGKVAVAGTIINDVASLILLSVLLQTVNQITTIPLPLFYVLLLASLFVLRWLIPRVKDSFSRTRKKDLFEHDLHVIFTILIGVVVFFELLGLHQITAGFFAGLVLSDSIESKKVKSKLHAIAYGIFIPVFFIITGANTDISLLADLSQALPLVILTVIFSISSKIFGGYITGRISGFNNSESLLLGYSGIPQLSTTLAVVFSGYQLGILSGSLIVSMVMLSICTTFVAPLLIRSLKI